MKKIILFIMFLTFASSNIYAIDIALTGDDSEVMPTSAVNPDYCDADIKTALEENRMALIIDDAEDVRTLVTEPPSVAPAPDEANNPCFAVPELSLSGIEDKVETIFRDTIGGVAGMMKKLYASAQNLASNIGGVISDPIGSLKDLGSSLLSGAGNYVNKACQFVVDKATKAKDAYIKGVIKENDPFNTIPYAGNTGINPRTYNFDIDASRLDNAAESLTAGVLEQ